MAALIEVFQCSLTEVSIQALEMSSWSQLLLPDQSGVVDPSSAARNGADNEQKRSETMVYVLDVMIKFRCWSKPPQSLSRTKNAAERHRYIAGFILIGEEDRCSLNVLGVEDRYLV